MKKLLFIAVALSGIHAQAAELKDLFPFSCSLVTKGPTGHEQSAQTITYKDESYLSYGIFPISRVNNSSFEFLYAGNNKFRAQYRRYETASEKRSRKKGVEFAAEIAKKNGDTKTAEKLTTGLFWGDEYTLTTDFAEEWVTVDQLMTADKEYRFSTPELPGTALVCSKDAVIPKR